MPKTEAVFCGLAKLRYPGQLNIKMEIGKICQFHTKIPLTQSSNFIFLFHFIARHVENTVAGGPTKKAKICQLPKSADFNIGCVKMECDNFSVACKQKFVISSIRIMRVLIYTLEVVEVFRVRSRTYKNLENHQMLWHGSRTMNFVSILTKRLRTAPKEAQKLPVLFKNHIFIK